MRLADFVSAAAPAVASALAALPPYGADMTGCLIVGPDGR
jgi:hypothetical protein